MAVSDNYGRNLEKKILSLVQCAGDGISIDGIKEKILEDHMEVFPDSLRKRIWHNVRQMAQRGEVIIYEQVSTKRSKKLLIKPCQPLERSTAS